MRVWLLVLLGCGRLGFEPRVGSTAGDGATGDGAGGTPDLPTGFYSIGGSVSGVTGTLVLKNGGDMLPISADGPYTFPTAVRDGATYAVTMAAQPTGETCNLGSPNGTVAGANITDVYVTCFATGSDPGILCQPGQYCAVNTEFCCLKNGGNGMCHPNGAACSSSVLDCDDSADCPGGICCATYDSFLTNWSAVCTTTGSTCTEIWCDPSATTSGCPSGTMCTGTAILAGRFTCK